MQCARAEDGLCRETLSPAYSGGRWRTPRDPMGVAWETPMLPCRVFTIILRVPSLLSIRVACMTNGFRKIGPCARLVFGVGLVFGFFTHANAVEKGSAMTVHAQG